MKKQMWVGAAAVLALSAAANAAVAWTVPAGAQSAFSYDNGQTLNGKFGSGTSNPSGFVLAPNQFVAGATQANSPVTTTDTASVVIHPNGPLVAVDVAFLGDYSIFGTGSVDAVATMTLTNLDTLAFLTQAVLVSGVPVATATNANGSFSGFFQFNAEPAFNGPNIKIELSAAVTATAGANSTALIELKDVDLTLHLFPEPTSLAAIGLSGTLLRRSRR